MKEKVGSVALYLLAGCALVNMARSTPEIERLPLSNSLEGYLAALTLPLLFFACIRAFFNLRFSHCLGMAAMVLTVPWFLETERTWIRFGSSSWIALNLPDRWSSSLRLMEWRIAAATLVLVTLFFCALRLLPARWTLRGKPWRERLWLAPALTLVVVGSWYGFTVSPYRIPIIVDGTPPEYSILHVEKDGLRFHETMVEVWFDGRFSAVQTERRLFQYRFPQTYSYEALPEQLRGPMREFAKSPVLHGLRGGELAPLRHWKDEGWYITSRASGPVGFVKSEGAKPPQEIIEVFRQLEALPISRATTEDAKDVCLGFCYEPWAGLGIVYVNQRCRGDGEGHTHCH